MNYIINNRSMEIWFALIVSNIKLTHWITASRPLLYCIVKCCYFVAVCLQWRFTYSFCFCPWNLKNCFKSEYGVMSFLLRKKKRKKEWKKRQTDKRKKAPNLQRQPNRVKRSAKISGLIFCISNGKATVSQHQDGSRCHGLSITDSGIVTLWEAFFTLRSSKKLLSVNSVNDGFQKKSFPPHW